MYQKILPKKYLHLILCRVFIRYKRDIEGINFIVFMLSIRETILIR